MSNVSSFALLARATSKSVHPQLIMREWPPKTGIDSGEMQDWIGPIEVSPRNRELRSTNRCPAPSHGGPTWNFVVIGAKSETYSPALHRHSGCPAKPPRAERINVLMASIGNVAAFAQKFPQIPSCRRYCSTFEV